MEFTKFLMETAETAGITIKEEQAEQLKLYKDMLLSWNEKINLTAITDEKEIAVKHFIDSISVLKFIIPKSGERAIDIGTGAGFPGIPLKIMCPFVEFTLLDSLNKRVQFLNKVIETLGLSGIHAVHMRAEDLAKEKAHREQYDFSFSRAVASLGVLSEYALPFVKTGGSFISYKGPDIAEEMKAAENAVALLGGKLKEPDFFKLPYVDAVHSILIIDKIKHTPPKYPRKPSLIQKTPLN